MPEFLFLCERGRNSRRLAAQETAACAHEPRARKRYQRAARVFLARLIIVHGPDAPHGLRRIADELEWLEEDARREEQERVALGAFSRKIIGSGARGPFGENRRLRACALRE